MKTLIVDSFEEIEKAKQEMAEKGYKLAAISNAGMPKGIFRLTFLPKEAFMQGD